MPRPRINENELRAREGFSLYQELKEELKDYCYRNRLTKSEVLVKSLEEFLAKNNKTGRRNNARKAS